MAARIPRKTGIVALSPELFLWAHHRRGRRSGQGPCGWPEITRVKKGGATPVPCLPVCQTGVMDQSNRLDTDSSAAVRPIASAIKVAIDSERMLGAFFTASVGWIESVMTSSFNFEEAMRVVAPPDSTPWVM